MTGTAMDESVSGLHVRYFPFHFMWDFEVVQIEIEITHTILVQTRKTNQKYFLIAFLALQASCADPPRLKTCVFVTLYSICIVRSMISSRKTNQKDFLIRFPPAEERFSHAISFSISCAIACKSQGDAILWPISCGTRITRLSKNP
jgi:hypothetical protein